MLSQYRLLIAGLSLIAAFIVGGLVAHHWDSAIYGKKLSDKDTAFEKYKTAIAQNNFILLQDQRKEAEKHQAQIAKIDKETTDEQFDYETRIDDILASLHSGRVFDKQAKAGNTGHNAKMPANSEATGKPDATITYRLSGQDAENLIKIAADGDKCGIKLKGLSKWADTVTSK